MTTEIIQRTQRLIARFTEDEFDLDTPVTDLGLDSLAWFEIVFELEESFAVELDETTLGGIVTVRDLAQAVRRELEKSGRIGQRAGG